MKLFLLAMLAVFFWGTAQQRSNPGPENADDDQLVALTNDWTEAINKRDRKKLDEIMATEYVLYGWNGKVLAERPKWLDNLFSHIAIERNSLTGLNARAYGDFGIVTSKGDWIGMFDGKHFDQRCTVVDTWRKLTGKWKVVARTSDCVDQ